MPGGNPLVATPRDDATALTGVGIAESAIDLSNGLSSGSWVDAGLGVAGVGLEVLSMVIDPIGTVASYGVSWLIEHVQPLKEALDWFAGDPPVIRSFSETWTQVAAEVNTVATDLANETGTGTAGWRGEAADAYRAHTAAATDAITGAGALADGVGAGVMIMGEVVAAVRELVRELVAEVVGRLISWALEAVFTLGLATPVIAAQASSAVAKVVNKIADLVRRLVRTIGNVSPMLRKVIDKLDEIISKLSRLGRHADGGSPTPSATTPSATTPSADTPSTTTPSTITPSTTTPTHAVDSPTAHSPDGTTSPATTSPASSTSPTGTSPLTTSPTRANGDQPSRTSSDGTSGPNRPADPNDTKTPESQRHCENDPVDVVTGEMVLAHVDVELPGVLPLVLRRTHVSSYRAGRSFGHYWASTVDQRLEFDARGAVFVAEDGMLLVYPQPPVSGAVLPELGPRWPLSRTPTGFAIEYRGAGRTLHFTAAPHSPVVLSGLVCHLSAIVDRNGNRVEFDRDQAGTVTDVRHSAGYHLDARSESGQLTELSLRTPDGPSITVVRFQHDAGRLTEVINSSGQAMRFDYDHAGRITQWTDRNGEWYRYFYDAAGRCVANQGSGGFLNGTFTYDPGVTRFTDALGHGTTYHHNAARQVIAVTDPLGHTVTQEWDEADRLVARTDALGHTTRFTYDEAGNLVATTRPDGVQALAEYDQHGQLTTFISPDGGVWRQEFDEFGNLVAETDPAGAVTRYGYGPHGHRSTVIDALGGVRRIETNPVGIPLAVTDELGATTRYTIDPFGRVTSITDRVGGVTRYAWTVEGRLLARTRPDGAVEHWHFDSEGNDIAYVDPLGRVSRTRMTHFNLPATDIRADGTRLEFGYDPTLRLVSVTNAQGLAWRYDYDAAGNLVRETDFNGRVLTYRHDAAGRLIERTNGAGQTMTFARDALGNIVERRAFDAVDTERRAGYGAGDWAGGSAGHSTDDTVTTIEYDAMNRLIRARNADTELVYRRDALGRVLGETVNGRTVTSEYDVLGRRVHRRTPTGATSRWDFDASARPASLRHAGRTLSFGYDAAGHEVERLVDTGTRLTQAWDANHRLVNQSVTAAGRLLQGRRYHYRADGHVTGVDDHLAGPRHYQLDMVGRVTGVDAAGWQERYAYDAAGNLAFTSMPRSVPQPSQLPQPYEPDEPGRREYAGTLVQAAGDIRYQHDRQGRVVVRQRKRLSRKPDTWHYTWDGDDRLIAVTTPDGTRWRYLYDPLGRRVAKLRLAPDGSVAERLDFAWDGTILAEQTHSGGHTTTWEFDPASYRPLTQTERARVDQQWVDQQFYAIVTDLAGTPTELLDAAGELAWRQESTLWGEALGRLTNRAHTPLRFPGQYHDPETGLHYNYLRYYDPAAGRYTSPDPLGLFGGLSPHAYVHNPIGWTDALGLTEFGDIEWVDPATVNFSQRTATENDYAETMRNGQWDWERSPLRVMEVDGQLVSYDNRRLDAAREVGQPVAIQRVDPNAPHPDSTTGKTWAEKFQERFRDPRNRLNGEPVPDTGLSERPTILPPGCGGGRRRRRR